MARPFVLGVDPSTKKLAVVGTTSRSQTIPDMWKIKLPPDPILRCGEAFRLFGELMYDLTQQCGGVPPRVFLEAPVLGRGGARPTIAQSQVGGSIMAACVEFGCPLVLVNNQTWKKQTLGIGNASKLEISKAVRKIWPEAWDAAEGDQDLIDASAIHLFGRGRVDLLRRLKIKMNRSRV